MFDLAPRKGPGKWVARDLGLSLCRDTSADACFFLAHLLTETPAAATMEKKFQQFQDSFEKMHEDFHMKHMRGLEQEMYACMVRPLPATPVPSRRIRTRAS